MKNEFDFARHNESQRAYFASRVKPTMIPVDTPYVQRQIDAVVDAIALATKDRVLEIGCGMGRYTIPLARRGFAVEGLDLTPELLERFRGFPGGEAVPLYCADILAAPDSLQRSFDAVIGFFMLHHLHDLRGSFQAIARFLKPGGRVAFVEPNPFNPLYYIQITLTPGMTWRGDKGIVKMRRKIIFEAMKAAGLVPHEIRRFGFFPPFLANRSLFSTVERSIEIVRPLNPILPFQLFSATLGDSASSV